MAISASKRKTLEGMGYKVTKSGSVMDKDGYTVGGINENGQVFSGNDKVRNVLKSKDTASKAAPKASAKQAPKAKAPAKKESSKKPAPNPRNSKGGRGDGNKEVAARKEAAKSSPAKVENSSFIPARGKVKGNPPSKRPVPKANATNPNYKPSASKTGFQGKYGGDVARTARPSSGGRIGPSVGLTRSKIGGGGKASIADLKDQLKLG